MNVLKYLLYSIIFITEIIISATNLWFIKYYSPIILVVILMILVRKENSALILATFGILFIDLLNSRSLGLISLYLIISMLIVELLSRQFAMIDNQARWVKILMITVLFLFFYFGHMVRGGIVSYPQMFFIASSYLVSISLLIPFTRSLNNSERNAIKI